jgi:pyridoxine 4-dehydrogenase
MQRQVVTTRGRRLHASTSQQALRPAIAAAAAAAPRPRRRRTASAAARATPTPTPPAPPKKFTQRDLVPLGQSSGILVAPLGLGTWAWGNRLLWGYDAERDDPRLKAAFDRAARLGVNLWDTGDSYGTSLPGGSGGGGGGGRQGAAPGVKDGRAEALLGEFDRAAQQAGGGGGGEEAGTTPRLLGGLLPPLFRATPFSSPPSPAIVATKLAAYPWRVTPESTVAAARASRRRVAGRPLSGPPPPCAADDDDPSLTPLGVAQAHWSTANYQPLQERAQLEGLARVYELGIARSLGLSNYGPKQLALACDFFERRIGAPPAVAQVQWSLLSDAQEQRDVAALCEGRGIALLGYSPLALGALTGAYDQGAGAERRPLPAGLRGQLLAGIVRKAAPLLACVRAVGAERNKTPAQVAIAWVRAQGAIPIPGAKTVAQVDEAVGAVSGWRLSKGELEALSAAQRASRAGRLMPRNVFQTR